MALASRGIRQLSFGGLRLLVLLVAASCSTPLRRDPVTATPETAPQVKLSLVAAAPPAPGQEVELGVRFDIPAGWHIYWINPGDAGVATRLSVGGGAFRLAWPCPKGIPTESGLSIGYEGTATVLARGVPDAGRVTVRASWLVCKDACHPGEGQVSAAIADLPVEDLDAARSALPSPPGTLTDFTPLWHETDDGFLLELVIRGADRAELYLSPDSPMLPRDQVSEPSRVKVRFARPARPLVDEYVTGVVRVDDVCHELRLETPYPHTG